MSDRENQVHENDGDISEQSNQEFNNSVPFSRFQEVNSKKKELEAELQALRQEKEAQKAQSESKSTASDEVRAIKMDLERRDLLDEEASARPVIDQVMAVARATGQSVKEVFNSQFREMAEKLSGDSSTPNMPLRTVNRGMDEDVAQTQVSKERNLQQLKEKAWDPKTPAHQREQLLREITKLKRFGS